MPTFSGYPKQDTAKGGVVSDGEVFVTDASNGHTVLLSSLSTYTAFKGVPVRSGTGVWSVTLKDPAYKVTFCSVKFQGVVGSAVDAIMQPVTANATTGQAVINWTFCTVGTATPADIGASLKFNVYVEYSETSIA